MTRTLVLLSGGIDSTTLLGHTADAGDYVDTLSVNYGQRHAVELYAARAVAAHYGVDHTILDLSVLSTHLTSALTGDAEVPHGHYTADTMKATVVPNRNAIMLMAAVGVAASRDMDRVVTAVHAGDHAVYPDCRPEFINAISHAAELGTAGIGDVCIDAPFVGWSKADIVLHGFDLGVPYDLTWSCYEGGDVHCGRCGTCVERAEAFHKAGVPDPTTYTHPDYWHTAVGVS